MTKILFTAFEAAPFVKTGGLGDVAGSLPAAVSSSVFDVRVVLPKLSAIPERYVKKMEFVTTFSVPLGWRNQYCGLFRLKHKGILYYFLDNEYYFKRDKVYGEFDDGERVAFFSKAVLEFILSAEEFIPDIIHCNDWHTALVPVLLREQYMKIPEFTRIKTVFTIHNLKFQGKFSKFVIGDICGLAKTPAAAQLLSDKHTANYLQGAVIYCDRITTVSPTYAEEIRMPYYGEGLDRLFNRRKDDLSGILNGIDYRVWNPAKDKKIPVNYDASTLAKKHENKLVLQKELGLEVKKEIPLFIIISRLTEQKGLDLVNYLLPKFQQRSMQLAVLGTGDKKYENTFLHYAGIDSKKFSATISFNNDLAHRMYAGADVLLMPSRFEPCGLTQMIAMRYGTLPLVRETGGLKDTVHVNNGFSFLTFNAQDMLYAVDCALDIWFNRKRRWRTMQKEAMAEDFSWKASAREYRKLYSELMT
ncbi:MAG TPA: glycogen synthase GlgA [Mogibacterium sp.]|nr:glycogen synthase GlgA [Mogibacterium sp.]